MNAPLTRRPFDVDAVRAQFAILGRSVNDRALVYLDNAASAQKPEAVIEAMAAQMRGAYANVHRGLHTLANETTEAFEAARSTVARFINAPTTDSIIFTKGGTHAINIVAAGLDVQAGDEIVLSVMEHHSNIVPWHFLRERQGAVLKWAPVDDEGNFLIEEFEKLLTPKTKIVAITQMSNALGTVVPVKEVVKIAHARGIPVLVDGSQALLDSKVIAAYIYERHPQPPPAAPPGHPPLQPTLWHPEHRFDDENTLLAIDAAVDSAINLFLLELDGVATQGSPYLLRQRERVASCLTWVDGRLAGGTTFHAGVFAAVDIALMCALQWMEFRRRYPVEEHRSLERFLEQHKERPSLASTHPSKAQGPGLGYGPRPPESPTR